MDPAFDLHLMLSFAFLKGLKFQVITSDFEENLDKSLFPHSPDYTIETASQKALDIYKRFFQVETCIYE